MLSIKIFFLYLVRFFARQAKWLLLGVVVIAVVALLFIRFKNEFLRPTIIEGVVGTYTEDNLPQVVTNLLSDPIVRADSNGKPMGAVAEGWQINEQGNVYTFKLKNDLYWIDGTKVKSSDIDINLPNVEVKNIDDLTIEFKLVDSFAAFPSLLTEKPLLKKGSLVGVGPYKIEEIRKDQIFVSKLVLVSDDSSLPRIIIRFYPSEKIASNALQLGEVQALIGVHETEEFSGEKIMGSYSKVNYGQLVTIFYNTKDPILSDENFRLALSFAAPSIKGEVEAKTSIPPSSWVFNNQVKDYLDNPQQSKTYLDKVKAGKDSTITLTATSFLQDVGEKVVEAWNKQGIKAVLRVESGIPQNFQALLISQNIPADPDQYSLWHSTQAQTNISKFSNPRVDKDLEDGRKSKDEELRKQRYQDFQKVLMDESPATFLYFPKYNVIFMRKIEAPLQKIIDLQLETI